MKQPDFSIIIVNWKVKNLLDKCLASILADAANYDLEIIVADNNSQDGSLQMLAEKYPQVIVLPLDNNLGFARANNLACQKATGKNFIFLNPDTEVSIGFFQQTFDYLQKNPQVSIFGPRIINPDGTLQASVRSLPNWRSQILILLKLKNLPGTKILFNKYLLNDFDYEKEQGVEQIMGAAMVVRQEAWQKIGTFDEKFFIWFEEVDFCQRAVKKGLEIRYFPGAKIIHYGGQSFDQRNTFKKQLLFNKSLLYYFYKHQPFWQLLLILLILPLNIFLTLIYVIFLQSKKSSNIG